MTGRLLYGFRMRTEEIVSEASSDSNGKHDEAVVGHE